MSLSGDTKVHDLLAQYPFLEKFLPKYNSKFEMLANPIARATVGRVATLSMAASIAGIDLNDLLAAITEEIKRHTGGRHLAILPNQPPAPGRDQRVQVLKEIILSLHNGGSLEAARERFNKAIQDVEASEIAAMEEQLIREGLPVTEVQHLCDLHVHAFRTALDTHAVIQAPPGHPIHTYLEDNKIIGQLANQLTELIKETSAPNNEGAFDKAQAVVDRLGGIENHYQRKENQIFPILERYGITGPSKVMWGVHDTIRAQLKQVREAIAAKDPRQFADTAAAFCRNAIEMVYKEEKILLPMAQQHFSDKEWVEIRKGDDELGYGLFHPEVAWPSDGQAVQVTVDVGDAGHTENAGNAGQGEGFLELMTGKLTLEQLNMILVALPVDLSFVDEHDTVLFYSANPERIFPRTPTVIGRKVQNCHPPKSLNIVQDILDSFRAGTQSKAEFWIQMQGKFIHIRYFAIRDSNGKYRGCLEVSQDVTEIRALQGQRRLLEWDHHASVKTHNEAQ